MCDLRLVGGWEHNDSVSAQCGKASDHHHHLASFKGMGSNSRKEGRLEDWHLLSSGVRIDTRVGRDGRQSVCTIEPNTTDHSGTWGGVVQYDIVGCRLAVPRVTISLPPIAAL